MWFFLIFVFSILVLGAFSVGPFSVRVYMTLLMMFALVITKKRCIYKLPSSYIIIYILFLVVTGMTLLANGQFEAVDFGKYLLSNYLVCIVAYYASDRFLVNEKSIQHFYCLLLSIVLITSVVSIFQFYYPTIGRAMSLTFINSTQGVEDLNEVLDKTMESELGSSMIGGIFGYPFTNALMIGSCGLFSFALFKNDNNLFAKLFATICLVLAFVGCFLTQERASFYMFVIFSVVFGYLLFVRKSRVHKTRTIFIAFFIVVVVLSYILTLPEVQLGRLVSFNFKEDTRRDIWNTAFDFLLDNFMLGGPAEYTKRFTIAPHNIFLYAFIYSGLIGGLIVLYMYIKIIIHSLRIFFPLRISLSSVAAAALLSQSVYSLTHNASLITGDTIIFVFLPVMLRARQLESSKL